MSGVASVARQPARDASPKARAEPPVSGANAAPALLRVNGLTVEFASPAGPLLAVDRVSFAIARGESVGVVGESGAGKSITGAAIVGLIDPPGRVAGGEIWFAGERIDNLDSEAMRRVRGKRIGMVFQDPLTSLNPLYTVGRQLIETITTHLDLTPRQAKKRAIDLLTEVGIPSAGARMSNYPHQFSGGQRQRVVIALALAAEPELVIADEPTTALDVSVQAQVIGVLKRLCREHGTAVMLITHDIGVIAETTHRVIVMYAGRIVEDGPVDAVLRSPQHPYTVGLMGAVPVVGGDEPRLVQIPGAMPRLGHIPTGCAFHPRCPSSFERCTREQPELIVSGASMSACWLHDKGRSPGA